MRIHDRDRLLAEQERALATLKGEHARAQQQAGEAAAREAECSALREALAERERMLADERGHAQLVEDKMEDLPRCVEGLAMELEAAGAERRAPRGGTRRRSGVPLSAGYRLVATGEPRPQPTAVVEVDGSGFVVAGIGRPPRPATSALVRSVCRARRRIARATPGRQRPLTQLHLR